MRYWWRNTGIGTRLGHEGRLSIEGLTGKMPILLNVLDKLPVKGKGQTGVDEAHDIFQQLVGGLLESHEVVSMQQNIHNFGKCQKEKYKDSTNITKYVTL